MNKWKIHAHTHKSFKVTHIKLLLLTLWLYWAEGCQDFKWFLTLVSNSLFEARFNGNYEWKRLSLVDYSTLKWVYIHSHCHYQTAWNQIPPMTTECETNNIKHLKHFGQINNNTQSCSRHKRDRKLTFPNSNRPFPEFTDPFCRFSSQLDLEPSVQMMVSALPKQLEGLAELPAAAKMYKHLGNFPTGVRSSNSIKCDPHLRQPRENKTSAGDI